MPRLTPSTVRPPLLAVTVARKPLSEGSVVRNVLKHGAGGLNIDECRIGSEAVRIQTWDDGAKPFGGGAGHPYTSRKSQGRWPSNLLLAHKRGCRRAGVKKVSGTSIHGEATAVRRSGVHSPAGGHQTIGRVQPVRGYSDEDGTETVDAWDCVPGCPVSDLDQQSGATRAVIRKPTGNPIYPTSGVPMGWDANNVLDTSVRGFKDEGGASRYFKQVQEHAMGIPQELVDYLITMVSPPEPFEPAEYLGDLSEVDWDSFNARPPQAVTGIIAVGTPTEDQATMLDRVLVPGAHLLLIAPDSEPTGHTGACRIEDAGFEIRDTVLLAQGAGAMHYVPKASRSEREAGCERLKPKTGAQAVGREEGSPGSKSAGAGAGAGRTAKEVRNFHPTVKAIGIMEALLDDVPKDAVVCDPFMGSGTTGIACIKKGHSFLGIERDEEYLPIADARVRYWSETVWEEGSDLGDTVEIQSDAPDSDREEPSASLMDLLFGGD